MPPSPDPGSATTSVGAGTGTSSSGASGTAAATGDTIHAGSSQSTNAGVAPISDTDSGSARSASAHSAAPTSENDSGRSAPTSAQSGQPARLGPRGPHRRPLGRRTNIGQRSRVGPRFLRLLGPVQVSELRLGPRRLGRHRRRLLTDIRWQDCLWNRLVANLRRRGNRRDRGLLLHGWRRRHRHRPRVGRHPSRGSDRHVVLVLRLLGRLRSPCRNGRIHPGRVLPIHQRRRRTNFRHRFRLGPAPPRPPPARPTPDPHPHLVGPLPPRSLPRRLPQPGPPLPAPFSRVAAAPVHRWPPATAPVAGGAGPAGGEDQPALPESPRRPTRGASSGRVGSSGRRGQGPRPARRRWRRTTSSDSADRLADSWAAAPTRFDDRAFEEPDPFPTVVLGTEGRAAGTVEAAGALEGVDGQGTKLLAWSRHITSAPAGPEPAHTGTATHARAARKSAARAVSRIVAGHLCEGHRGGESNVRSPSRRQPSRAAEDYPVNHRHTRCVPDLLHHAPPARTKPPWCRASRLIEVVLTNCP